MTKRIDQDGNELEFIEPDPERVERKRRLSEIEEHNRPLLEEIGELEALVTPRRIREAVIDPSWIIAHDAKITNLRKQLKTL